MGSDILYYSQNFEDVYLWRCFGDVDNGFYVDVGARDPEFESVTKLFYDQGWNGINVDPSPSVIAAFERDRQRDENVLAFADSSDGLTLDFYENHLTGRSTGVPEYRHLLDEDGLSYRVIQVTTVTLDALLSRDDNRVIHFLKIDAEGAELRVLRGLDLSRRRPQVIVLEAVDPHGREAVDTAEIAALLTANDYEKVFFDGLNTYWCAAEVGHLKRHFLLPPGCLDGVRPYQVIEARKQVAELVARSRCVAQGSTATDADEKPVFLLLSHASPGLAQDRKVVAQLLSVMGYEVHSYDLPSVYYLQGIPVPLPESWGRVVAIMFEHVFVLSRRPLACLYYVNPEWILDQDLSRIRNGDVDVILTKTRDAHARISAAFEGIEIVHTGFASLPLPPLSIPMSFEKAIHVRGYARQKGTDVVLDAYRKASDRLPECICTMRAFDPTIPPFVSMMGSSCRLLFKDLPQPAMDRMVARRGLHLCPSEREGFGHYIFGPMSVGAVVLTTDSAPMNELVDAGCGMLVPARIEDKGLYLDARVSASDLIEKIQELMALSPDQKLEMGRRAQLKAAAMREDFESRFQIFISFLVASLAGSA